MTKTAVVSLSTLGLATLAGASAAWAHYGGVIYFDMITAGLAGCFF